MPPHIPLVSAFALARPDACFGSSSQREPPDVLSILVHLLDQAKRRGVCKAARIGREYGKYDSAPDIEFGSESSPVPFRMGCPDCTSIETSNAEKSPARFASAAAGLSPSAFVSARLRVRSATAACGSNRRSLNSDFQPHPPFPSGRRLQRSFQLRCQHALSSIASEAVRPPGRPIGVTLP